MLSPEPSLLGHHLLPVKEHCEICQKKVQGNTCVPHCDSSLRSQVLINRKRFWDSLEDVDQQELGDCQFPLKLRCIQAPAALLPVLDSLLLPASSRANHCCEPQQWTVNCMLKPWDCTFLQSEIHVKNMLEQNYLLLINLKSWSSCLFQTHCKPPNGVVMWSSLNTQPDHKIMKRKIPAQERFTWVWERF